MRSTASIEAMADRTGSLRALGELLTDAGFTARRMCERLDVPDAREVLANAAWHSFAEGHSGEVATDACDVLLRLFVLNLPTPSAEFTTHVPGALRAVLAELEMVQSVGDFTEGTVTLSPVPRTTAPAPTASAAGHAPAAEAAEPAAADLIVVTDQLFVNHTPHGGGISFVKDAVMPPHASTFLLLDHCTPPEPGSRLVDLGSGSGVTGLLLARAGQRIVGYDIDARAVAYSRVNAALNGQCAEYHVGDATAPERTAAPADSLVFNSPTAPTMDDLGQMTAEEAVRATLGCASTLLRPGGRASLLVMFEVTDGRAAMTEQVLGWLGPRAAEADVRYVESAQYGVSAESIRKRSLDARCALVRDQESKEPLFRYLDARGIQEIVPAMVEFTMAAE